MSQIGRVGRHAVLQHRSEAQNFVLHFDRVGGILGEILRLRYDDRDSFPLQIDFARQWFG